MPREPMPDVVVLLPGILGSVLQRDGNDVWALSGSALARAVLSGTKSLKNLALPADSPDAEDVGDGIVATRLLSDVHMIPGFWTVDGYTRIADEIRARFDVTPGRNYFEFAYDWRRDNRIAARRLARECHGWLRNWREVSGNKDAKLVLLAHSMGGLVSRYFLEVLDGWKETRALVTFGTPYRGSLNALNQLSNGLSKKLAGVTWLDLSAMLRSFTSVYQLLPVYECYDPGNGRLVRVGEAAGIPNVDASRAAAALAFHREIEAAVDGHLKDEAYLRDRYSIVPVTGIQQPTNQSARAAASGVEMLRSLGGRDLEGDGTVPRLSAVPIELSSQLREVFAAARHASLHNSDSVLVQVEGVLRGVGLDLGAYRFVGLGGLSLDIEDVYARDEPIVIRARASDESLELTATITDTAIGRVVARLPLTDAGNEWSSGEAPPLAEGVYRVAVSGDGRAEPVSDLIYVA